MQNRSSSSSSSWPDDGGGRRVCGGGLFIPLVRFVFPVSTFSYNSLLVMIILLELTI
jgi:hypothetical protein